MSEPLSCATCGVTYDPEQGDLHLCYDPWAPGPNGKPIAPTLGVATELDDFVRLVVGPVGSGKSSWAVMEILRRGVKMPRCRDGLRHSRFAVIRNTYPELRDTTRKTFEQWIPDALRRWHEQSFTCFVSFADVRIEVLFRALDTPDDVKKLLSLELTGAYVNEVKEIHKLIFDGLQMRVGRYPSKKDACTEENPLGLYWSGVWADTNPPDTDHWIYKLFEEEGTEERVYETEGGRDIVARGPQRDLVLEDGSKMRVTFSLLRQPDGVGPDAENRSNHQPGYYQRLCIGKDEDWINVYVHGLYGFVKEGKPVFPEFNDTRHVGRVAPLPHLPILIGMDFGLTPAAVLAQRDRKDGQLQVFRELVTDDMGAVTFGQELRKLIAAEYPGREVRGHGDPAGEGRAQTDERTCYDVLDEHFGRGLVRPAPTNDLRRRLEAGKQILLRSTMLGRAAFVLDPVGAPKLRKALAGGYHRARVKNSGGDERYHDEPLKNEYSHVADGWQYLLVGEGEDRAAIEGTTSRKAKVRFKVKRSVKFAG